jgi:hypothetical protein
VWVVTILGKRRTERELYNEDKKPNKHSGLLLYAL